jgi:broad specificity phosphatase PhoE
MKPKRIILIRHGESEANADRNTSAIKPDYTVMLTPKGHIQAAEAGVRLKNIVNDESVFFYVSPYWRTRQTFKNIVSKIPPGQYVYREEPRLREQEWGHLRLEIDGKSIERYRKAFGVFYYRIPEGESAADVYDRVSDFFGTLFRDFEKENYPDNTVIVTHGMSIRLFLMRWFHWTVEQFETKKNPENCDIIVLERKADGKFELLTELGERAVKHAHQMPQELNAGTAVGE